MHPAIELTRFVLGDLCSSDEAAAIWLERALESEAEPLDYFAVHGALGDELAYRRAAEWAGLGFSPAVPASVPTQLENMRTEALAGIRSLRAPFEGRDMLFAAAGLGQLISISQRVAAQPELQKSLRVVPPRALRNALADRSAQSLLADSRNRLARLWPHASAHLDLPIAVRISFGVILTGLVLLAALTPLVLQPVLVPFMGFLLLVPALMRFGAIVSHWRRGDRPEAPPLPEAELPGYTILVPLRDEDNMVRQIADALRALDYPADKLDIKFVVEAASQTTLEAVMRELHDPRFEMMIVPEAQPATKPKALNYALPLARGQHLVIYDAEDIPEPDQLRKAAAIFAAEPEFDCIQAELVIDNARESVLTRLYTGEYGGLFGIMLPALARWRMPLPLGGTSNHFRVQSLNEVGGWDAFNVTEDADLGVRLSRLRYRTGAFTSRTYEEAPFTFSPWLKQRTRWMKGWMQTFIVHNSRPVKFFKDIGWRNFMIFQAYVGGMIFSAPLHSVFLAALLIRLAMGFETGLDFSSGWEIAQLAILVAGYGSAILLALVGLVRLGWKKLLGWQLLLPVYWVLTSLAAVLALYQLMVRPYFWAKTPHGVTRLVRGRRGPSS